MIVIQIFILVYAAVLLGTKWEISGKYKYIIYCGLFFVFVIEIWSLVDNGFSSVD